MERVIKAWPCDCVGGGHYVVLYRDDYDGDPRPTLTLDSVIYPHGIWQKLKTAARVIFRGMDHVECEIVVGKMMAKELTRELGCLIPEEAAMGLLREEYSKGTAGIWTMQEREDSMFAIMCGEETIGTIHAREDAEHIVSLHNLVKEVL